MTAEARAAYLAALRAQDRGTRNAGYVACLLGVLVMMSGRYATGAPAWLVYVGLPVILLGWGLLAYAVFKRAAYARAHPFDPQDQ